MSSSYQERCRLARQRLSLTVNSQCFSPCGKYLAVCTNFGQISVFNIQAALGPDATDTSWKPFFIFQAHGKCQIFHMTCLDQLLISAATDSIKAWQWKDITGKVPVSVWALSIPLQLNRLDVPEVNSVCVAQTEESTRMYAGAGDSNIHIWDIQTGAHEGELTGHKNYIHALRLRNSSREIVSASEDGSVRIWDLRTPQEPVVMIEPYKNEKCARPLYGRWLGCLDVDPADEWMVCGGGPNLSLWHLRSLTLTTVFEAPTVVYHHTQFYEDTIISGGSESFVHHWDLNGDERMKIPCTPASIMNITINDNAESGSTKVLSVAGNSNTVDIFTNFGYRAFSLSVL